MSLELDFDSEDDGIKDVVLRVFMTSPFYQFSVYKTHANLFVTLIEGRDWKQVAGCRGRGCEGVYQHVAT